VTGRWGVSTKQVTAEKLKAAWIVSLEKHGYRVEHAGDLKWHASSEQVEAIDWTLNGMNADTVSPYDTLLEALIAVATAAPVENLRCATCTEPAPYAEANLPGGKFRCFSCRRVYGLRPAS
jgi:hypothetical protein